MSVLNQSGEEQVECPLCMEPLEVDDFNFFPCTCGYQICRFCWHRIRTDENGLCPACRKAYSENPADFTPLSKEQVAQLKAEKRQRDQQRKAKLSESRKHLASVRVVQRNLVFVVGLPMRLADPEILRRHEYFGKFGKIHKVVINQSPQYAGTQGPSASAYVTYMKSDDALRAIQNVNNVTIDGRVIKSSLGTTKYCSHFMKNQPCPKSDCMYLHDFGDAEASFTKEQMHAGKHQEYEKKLHEALLSKLAQPDSKRSPKESNNGAAQPTPPPQKDSWPQAAEKKEPPPKPKAKPGRANKSNAERKAEKAKPPPKERDPEPSPPSPPTLESTPKLAVLDDNSSFFSQNAFQKLAPDGDDAKANGGGGGQTQPPAAAQSLLDANGTEDWEAAFGFTRHGNHLEELAKQRGNVKGTLETFGGGEEDARRSSYEAEFGPLDGYPQNGYDITKNIIDVLANNKNGTYPQYKHLQDERLRTQLPKPDQNGVTNTLNGLDQQMVKFFSDLQSRNHHKHDHETLRRQQIEEQLHNLKTGYGAPYLNGDAFVPKQADEELDFDPFQETQKALAELIESEQHKAHSSGEDWRFGGGGEPSGGRLACAFAAVRPNGMQHHGSGGQLPPPPPGFVQPHMNSFGSKILPYLNMNSSSSQQQGGWPPSYGQTQHKAMGNCNDWKVLDPAIVSSSRYCPLASMGERYGTLQSQTQQHQQQLRSYDFANTFSNFAQQIQPQQNLNSWLGSELNTKISSPPGFRSANHQSTKQQEC